MRLQKDSEQLRRTVSNLTFDKLSLRGLQSKISKPRSSPSLYRPCRKSVQSLGTASLPKAAATSVYKKDMSPRGVLTEIGLLLAIIKLARQFGRCGYFRVVAVLRQAGWCISDRPNKQL